MKIERVSQKEMKRRTGLSGAKGYTFPEKETILLLKGMSRTEEKIVLEHEMEHYKKGEEGPWIGAVIGGVASLAAAGKASSGAQAGIAETARQYDIGQANLRPYQQAGLVGLEGYQRMLADGGGLPEWGGFRDVDMYADPGYQFRLGEGYQGLERMAARGGERFSGKLGIGLQDYGQRMASQEFGAARGRAVQDYGLRRTEGLDRLSQWANLAASGQQAAGAASNLGANYANSISGLHQASANAQAAGIMGAGQNIMSGLAAYNYNQGYNNYNESGTLSGIDMSAVQAGMGGAG